MAVQKGYVALLFLANKLSKGFRIEEQMYNSIEKMTREINNTMITKGN